jgi:membrane protease YdiL (CAAX protease family)
MRRLIELVVLFGLVPAALAAVPGILVIPVVLSGTGMCLAVLLRDRSFDRAALWRADAVRRYGPRILVRAMVGCVIIAFFVIAWRPGAAFALPRTRPLLWLLILVAYPTLSAYPQEVVFRAFFFHRYRCLFAAPAARVAASAIAFGYAHIVLHNILAIGLTLLGGTLFAASYERSRSTFLATLEHAIYGSWLFTVGLGGFFYAAGRTAAALAW